MKKLPKRPRTFARTKAKPYPQKKQEPRNRRLPDWKIDAMGDIFPGFADFYRRNYDENGKYIGERIPGLNG